MLSSSEFKTDNNVVFLVLHLNRILVSLDIDHSNINTTKLSVDSISVQYVFGLVERDVS